MLTEKQRTLLVFIHDCLNERGVSPSFDEMKDALGLKSKSGIHRLITALEERGFLKRLPHRARALEVTRLPDDMQTQQPVANRRFAALSRENEPVGDNLRPAPPWLESVTAGRTPAASEFDEEGDQLSDQDLAAAGPNVVRGDFGRAREMAVAQGREVSLPLYGKIAAGMPIEALANESEYLDVPTTLLGNGQYYALQVEGDSMIEAGIHDGDYVIVERGDTAHNGDIVVALVDNYEVTLKRLRKRSGTVALEPANARYETRIFGPDRVKVQGRLAGLVRRY